MKILLLSHYFLPHRGGIEAVVHNQAKGLAKLGHKVTVISSAIGSKVPRETMDGFTVIRVPALNTTERILGVPFPVFSPKLTSVIEKELVHADIVHAHGSLYPTTQAAAILCKKYKKPFILTEHVAIVPYASKTLQHIQKTAYNNVGRIAFTRANAIFALNPDVRTNAIAYGADPDKITYLANGVDTTLFSLPSAAKKKALKKEFGFHKPVALFLGRFVEKKGFPTVIKATGPEYIIACVGDGVKPSESDPAIRYFTTRPPKDIAKLFKASDVFILPSVGEGFPMAIQEAMATGLPVITTKNPNYKTYVNTTYFEELIKPTSESLRAAILKTLTNKKRYAQMSSYGAKTAKEVFSWKKHIDTLVTTYIKTSKKMVAP